MREDVREDYDEEEVDHLEDVTERPARPLRKKSRRGRLTAEDKQWGMFCHLSGLAGAIIPFGNIIGPLVCWSMKKEESRFVDYHGKESVNFQICLMIVCMICFITIIGIPIAMLLGIAGIVMPILAGLKANEGEYYEYPYIFRVIK
jgi:uncharacterized protein